MARDDLLATLEDGVLTLTFNRPGTLNALTIDMMDALVREASRARFDDAVRVVVLQGAGGNFCSGADMDLLASLDHREVFFAHISAVCHLVRMEKPVVSKVSGHAAGAGCSFALVSDFAIAAADAAFQMTFTRLGGVPDMGGTYVLPRLVGMARAKAIAMLGDRVSGREAADWGMIYRAVEPRDLDAAVDELVKRLLKMPAEAVGLTKRGLEHSLHATIDEAVDWEMSHQSRLVTGERFQQSVRDFLARRGKR